LGQSLYLFRVKKKGLTWRVFPAKETKYREELDFLRLGKRLSDGESNNHFTPPDSGEATGMDKGNHMKRLQRARDCFKKEGRESD